MKKLKVLPITIRKNAHDYTQIKRTKDAAIYEQFDPRLKEVVGYEVFRIFIIDRKMIDKPEMNFKLPALRYEKFPSNSDFGKSAWGCNTFERAIERFNNLNQTSI